MPGLRVETEDFAIAARSVHDQVGDSISAALDRLSRTLSACEGMAGNDPAGEQWARDYDLAAAAAIRASVTATNSVYHLATMLAQSARNYEAAEAASTAGRHHLPVEPMLLPDTVLVWDAATPSACGAGDSGPPGWSLVMHLVHAVWPNGHQDKLHAAADAWLACAATLDGRSDVLVRAPDPLENDRLPEGADVRLVCRTVADRLHDLASTHRSLGRACLALAGHIDEAHSEIDHELISLLEWTAGIQVVGGLLSAVTLGAAEAPTQSEEAARIAVAAARIGAVIEKFAALARAATEALPGIGLAADSIARAMEEFVSGRLAVATVSGVRTLPATADAEGITVTEMAAEERLAGEAGRGLVPSSGRAELSTDFNPPAVFRNRHGQLTNGRYAVSTRAMAPHVRGSLAAGKSQFFGSVDSEKAVLDAAAYADENALWVGNRAKVYIENGPVGVWAKTGEPTRWINVYRQRSGAVHGSPGGPP